MVAQEQEELSLVTIVVDANILFSVIVKSDGVLAKLWFDVADRFDLVAPAYLLGELHEHHQRLCKLSGLTSSKVAEVRTILLEDVSVILEKVVSLEARAKAVQLTSGLDEEDAPYVALAIYFNCPLWTGDKKLIAGLVKRGFKDVVDTSEVRAMLDM